MKKKKKIKKMKRKKLKKKKIIIKKKKKQVESNIEIQPEIQEIVESKTDDELGPGTKKLNKRKIKNERKTTTDVPSKIKREGVNIINENRTEEKMIIKKKIIKKKIIKKKKKEEQNSDIININEEKSKNERPETAKEHNKININDEKKY